MTNPIRSYREKHGLTLEAFGDIVGVKKAAVGKWENGIAPSVESAKVIEEKTYGAITRQQLRPDIWDAKAPPPPQIEGAAA